MAAYRPGRRGGSTTAAAAVPERVNYKTNYDYEAGEQKEKPDEQPDSNNRRKKAVRHAHNLEKHDDVEGR